MKSILIVTSTSFPPSEGLGTHIDSLATALSKRGLNVVVLTRGLVGTIKAPYKIMKIDAGRFPILNSIKFWFHGSRALRDESFDVVHYHSPLLLPLTLKNIPQRSFATIHSTMLEDTRHTEIKSVHSLLNRLAGLTYARWIEYFLIRQVDHVIAVSDGVKQELFEQLSSYSYKVNVITNGIDLAKFARDSSADGMSRDFVFLGRIGYRKGIEELANALLKCQDFFRSTERKFFFYGEGELKAWLVKFINYHKLTDFIEISSATADGVAKILRPRPFVFITSTYETGPRVLLESLAMGCNVYSTNVGLANSLPKHVFNQIKATSTDAISDAFLSADSMSLSERVEKSIGASNYAARNFDLSRLIEELLK